VPASAAIVAMPAKKKTLLLELRRGFGVIPATTRHVTQNDLEGD
jgi:hypothetical protein